MRNKINKKKTLKKKENKNTFRNEEIDTNESEEEFTIQNYLISSHQRSIQLAKLITSLAEKLRFEIRESPIKCLLQ